MVEEPTKTLRGALAFFRGASCSFKSRDPIKSEDRIIDFTMGRRKVNETNKNKRVLFDRGGFQRMNSPPVDFQVKECSWRASAKTPLRRLLGEAVHFALNELAVGAVAAQQQFGRAVLQHAAGL